MKHPSAPLTPDEIRDGLARLMTSPFMTSEDARRKWEADDDDFECAADWAAQFKVQDSAARFHKLAEVSGTSGNVPSIIHDLAVALVTHRLGENEVFRLGTSEEALRFFEENCDEWAQSLRRTADRAAKAEEAEA